jgi:hypothetical protein
MLCRGRREREPADEPRAPAPQPAAPAVQELLALQHAAGNAAVTRLLARQPAGPALRTALNSQLRTEAKGGGFGAVLELDGPTQSFALPVASWTERASTEFKHLPVYLEDVVSWPQAVVTIQYDPDIADVTPAFRTREVDGIQVEVRLEPKSEAEMSVPAAEKAKRVHGGVVVGGGESVTAHESASTTDKVMGSVASAEGTFATVEGSDKGVFTWGQGQWTVTAGELQRVLAFIKERRPDLFERYWGLTGLDVGTGSNPEFIVGGRAKPHDEATMMALFRPSIDRVTYWASVFAAAGNDPQIQRLQREFMRDEVESLLDTKVGAHAPSDALDTRGQAFFYSMEKNAPAVATVAFKTATASLPATGAITDAQKTAASGRLEEAFRNSSVVARSKDDHHIIAFWGEGGRKLAVQQAEDRIAEKEALAKAIEKAKAEGTEPPAPDPDPWTIEDWKAQKARMQVRESRYQKTRADIDAALARREVEPDVPDGVFGDEPASHPFTLTP